MNQPGPARARSRRLPTVLLALLLLVGSTATAPVAHADSWTIVPLSTWWHEGWEDNTLVPPSLSDYMRTLGYVRMRGEFGAATAFQNNPAYPQRELTLMWHEGRQDDYITATNDGRAAGFSAGYKYVMTLGYVFANPGYQGTVPLTQWWHPGRGDNLLAATRATEDAARAAGYVFVRVEGYGWIY
ncbi:hypothetical protein [Saccharothrix texasensis]|uniref:Uncharacterized protein n=1 Tax=Saccharothrix texasensis TaxID=103734 RepID=A0A3N1HJ84_9PSEU|nr:hypothetical protein [Saccharothrix texasensis]ROP42526.1 hypothetical protein EDD40_8030 [Saccharothrix texasensis]